MHSNDLAASASERSAPTVLVSLGFEPRGLPDPTTGDSVGYASAGRSYIRLLRTWCRVEQVDHPESRLDYAVWKARQRGEMPLHLTFLPLQRAYLSGRTPNVAFSGWALGDLPDGHLDDDPRHNLVRIAGRLDLVLTASRFTRDAFVRAGVRTPVEVVPLPVEARYSGLPEWRAGERVELKLPALRLSSRGATAPLEPAGWLTDEKPTPISPARRAYRLWIKPHLSASGRELVARSARAVGLGWQWPTVPVTQRPRLGTPANAPLALSGVVYASEVDPFEARHNWTDLLTAFLGALGHMDDATLVLQLTTPPERLADGLERVATYYSNLGRDHRCGLVLVAGPLARSERLELLKATTFYLSATRAEGYCQSLQRYLAAGRPAVGPAHSALAEYLDDQVGLVVDSSPEPAPWPEGFNQPPRALWQRISWQSLHDQIGASYELARQDVARYQALACRARARMAELASPDLARLHLRSALERVEPSEALIRG